MDHLVKEFEIYPAYAKSFSVRKVDWFLALGIFLPTLFFVPPELNLAVVALLLLACSSLPIRKMDVLLYLFLFFSIFNTFVGLDRFSYATHGLPFSFLLFLPCVWVGRKLSVGMIKLLVLFTFL